MLAVLMTTAVAIVATVVFYHCIGPETGYKDNNYGE